MPCFRIALVALLMAGCAPPVRSKNTAAQPPKSEEEAAFERVLAEWEYEQAMARWSSNVALIYETKPREFWIIPRPPKKPRILKEEDDDKEFSFINWLLQ